jgi:hypothetical protein
MVIQMRYGFLDLLLDAESAAQDDDEIFVDEIRDRWLTYGPDMEITESELKKLKQIAGLS